MFGEKKILIHKLKMVIGNSSNTELGPVKQKIVNFLLFSSIKAYDDAIVSTERLISFYSVLLHFLAFL